jgi:nuclear pore complex protein Nup188
VHSLAASDLFFTLSAVFFLKSGSWSLSGKLAKMILIDCEKNDTSCPLVISVLEFTMQLVEGGLENDVVFALVVFSLQYILASHEYWKYNHGNMRWKVTLKVCLNY